MGKDAQAAQDNMDRLINADRAKARDRRLNQSQRRNTRGKKGKQTPARCVRQRLHAPMG